MEDGIREALANLPIGGSRSILETAEGSNSRWLWSCVLQSEHFDLAEPHEDGIMGGCV